MSLPISQCTKQCLLCSSVFQACETKQVLQIHTVLPDSHVSICGSKKYDHLRESRNDSVRIGSVSRSMERYSDSNWHQCESVLEVEVSVSEIVQIVFAAFFPWIHVLASSPWGLLLCSYVLVPVRRQWPVLSALALCHIAVFHMSVQFRRWTSCAILMSTFVWNHNSRSKSSLNVYRSENRPLSNVRSSIDETVVNLNDGLSVSLTFWVILTTLLHTVFTPWPVW